MQCGKISASLGESPEIRCLFHPWNARKLFAQVVGKAGAVVLAVQDAVDVVEQVLFDDLFTRVCLLEMGEPFIRDGITSLQTRLLLLVIAKQVTAGIALLLCLLIVKIEREALAVKVVLNIRNHIRNKAGKLLRTIP